MRVDSASKVSPRNRISAFTLPEVLVAIGISSLMLSALYASFTFGYTEVKMCRQELRATQIMVEQMEMVRLLPITNLVNFTTNVYADPIDQSAGGGGTVYSMKFTTNKVVMSGVNYQVNNMRLITATVTWTNGNIIRTNTMQTFFAKNGLQTYVYGPPR
jgi:prepilin-type N-terminal cleavage/methylation domain-containing protein